MRNGEMIDKAMMRYRCLRGFLAIWIVLGHCSMYLDTENIWLEHMQSLNLLCVAVFFFQSGYGLERARETKADYLKGFLLKKPLRLFVLALISSLINTVIQFSFGRNFSGTPEVLQCIREFINWYVWVQILFYLLFFLSAKVFRRDSVRIVVLTVSVLIATEALRHTNWGIAYYTSGLAFPAGVVLASRRESFEKLFQKNRLACIFVTAILSALCMLLVKFPWNHPANIYGKNLTCAFVGLLGAELMLLLPDRLPAKLQGIKAVSQYLSGISLEIYLYQFVMINAASTWLRKMHVEKETGFVMITVAGTLLMAVLVSSIRKRVEKGKIRQEHRV